MYTREGNFLGMREREIKSSTLLNRYYEQSASLGKDEALPLAEQ